VAGSIKTAHRKNTISQQQFLKAIRRIVAGRNQLRIVADFVPRNKTRQLANVNVSVTKQIMYSRHAVLSESILSVAFKGTLGDANAPRKSSLGDGDKTR